MVYILLYKQRHLFHLMVQKYMEFHVPRKIHDRQGQPLHTQRRHDLCLQAYK